MLKSLVAVAALAVAGSANAAVLFSDDFDAQPTALAVTSLSGWTVTGNVDVVEGGTYSIGCSGKCIDLDGTPGPGAILSNQINFVAGRAVTVSFDVSGNQRNGSLDNFLASVIFTPANSGTAWLNSGPADFTEAAMLNMLGGTTFVESISGDRSFITYSYSFIANASGAFQLGFGTLSADNIGPVLDNVLVTQAAVPEPATWAMLIVGFGLVGAASRRRRPLAA